MEDEQRLVAEWLSKQDIIEDCRLGVRLSVASCEERQARIPHKEKIKIGRVWTECRAAEFASCVGCPHYVEREHNAQEAKDRLRDRSFGSVRKGSKNGAKV